MADRHSDKERLKKVVEDVLEQWGPDKAFMVSNVAVIAEIIDESGMATVINVHTMGTNPWLLLGILSAEVLRAETRIDELNQLTLEAHEDDDDDRRGE